MLVLFAHLLSLKPGLAGRGHLGEEHRHVRHAGAQHSSPRSGGAIRPNPCRDHGEAQTGRRLGALIRRESGDADVVLLGLQAVVPGHEITYAARLEEMTEQLPSVLFVRSAGEFRGRLVGGGIESAAGSGRSRREGEEQKTWSPTGRAVPARRYRSRSSPPRWPLRESARAGHSPRRPPPAPLPGSRSRQLESVVPSHEASS